MQQGGARAVTFERKYKVECRQCKHPFFYLDIWQLIHFLLFVIMPQNNANINLKLTTSQGVFTSGGYPFSPPFFAKARIMFLFIIYIYPQNVRKQTKPAIQYDVK